MRPPFAHLGLCLCLPLALVLSACTDAPSSADTSSEDEGGSETGEPLLVTWHQDIAPIIAKKCSNCHREDGIAPFAMTRYEEVVPRASEAIEAIEAGIMPPWGQASTEECEARHSFKYDPRLDEDERALFQAWIDNELAEGDPATAAPLPEPASLDLEGADLRVTMEGEFELEPGPDQFMCYVLDPGLDATAFIDGVQIVAGNEKIVHHVLLYVDESGASEGLAGDDGRYPCFGGPGTNEVSLIAAWAPGVPPAITPPEIAMTIPAGAKLIMNVHYSSPGVSEVDPGTAVDLRFATGAPQFIGQLQLIGNIGGSLGGGMGLQPGPNDTSEEPEFRIPAGVKDHTETMLFRLPPSTPEIKMWLAGTHMHYLGTDMLLGLDRQSPEPGTGIDEECLVQTPNYSFEWQRGYEYDAPIDELPTLRGGDYMYMRCTYDNSMDNPYLVEALEAQGLDAPIDVLLGDETLDEMCLGVYGFAVAL